MNKKTARIRRATKARSHIRRLGKARLTIHRSGRIFMPRLSLRKAARCLRLPQPCKKTWPRAWEGTNNKEAAVAVGKAVAERAVAAGVKEVAFDRSGFKYHGRVKVLADAAREGGLQF